MPIRTRLFVLIALLVLTLVGVQWWLGNRQIDRAQDDMVAVAATVSHQLIAEVSEAEVAGSTGPGAAVPLGIHVVSGATGATGRDATNPLHPLAGERGRVYVLTTTLSSPGTVVCPPYALPTDAGSTAAATGTFVAPGPGAGGDPAGCVTSQHFALEVQRLPGSPDGCIVVRRGGDERRIAIPIAASTQRARASLQRGLLLGGGLLAAGLLAAAFIAHRVTGPLRQLAAGVEEVGRGGFQARVAVTAGGEVGELQRGFNAMAGRLAALEGERDAWREREHLAQLGDLARGLAHTLRNPLNTLGLAVEELAERHDGGQLALVATARAQIRRVDRWLVSFLALGAGRGITREVVDLADEAGEAVLEAVQAGARVELVSPPTPVIVSVVRGALRAAVQSLVENAVAASPGDAAVTVTVTAEPGIAVLRVEDRGAGLPREVRERLFSPHVTTRPGGAGMGLFLARQLVETGLGGRLEIRDREGGGTVAEIALPADEPGAGPDVS